jgi:hypothetical protein
VRRRESGSEELMENVVRIEALIRQKPGMLATERI